MKVLVLHAYSAKNLGDGLLVKESLELIRQACGESVEITIAASHPASFDGVDAKVVDSQPRRFGWSAAYLRTLYRINDFDLIVGVGGGYLRAGTPIETAKTILVHGLQLWAASVSSTSSVYLPQSIGPVRFGLRRLVASRLRNLSTVMLRDDRSMHEFGDVGAIRMPDLAAGEIGGPAPHEIPLQTPVLSVREVHGKVPPLLPQLGHRLGQFDAYVQSTSGGNDDRPATSRFASRRIIGRDELLFEPNRKIRGVLAVRLHAALMALRAGHYVIHLAYERKGFGAFDDLGISDYVHNVNSFSVEKVINQVQALLLSEETRQQYRAQIAESSLDRSSAKNKCIEVLRSRAGLHA